MRTSKLTRLAMAISLLSCKSPNSSELPGIVCQEHQVRFIEARLAHFEGAYFPEQRKDWPSGLVFHDKEQGLLYVMSDGVNITEIRVLDQTEVGKANYFKGIKTIVRENDEYRSLIERLYH